jgi:hypothetical protein
MQSSFSQVIERWHDFYLAASTDAATLIGLLFIGLSLNLEVITSVARADLRALALKTFNNLLSVLILALVFLIPAQTPLGLGLPLLAIGMLGAINASRQLRAAVQNQDHLWGSGYLFRRFLAPTTAYLGLIAIATSLATGETSRLPWLVAVLCTLLATATRNAWDLLVRVGEYKHDREAKRVAAEAAERLEEDSAEPDRPSDGSHG